MPNFNHVTVAGHLGRNPDQNAAGSVAKFSLAVNDHTKAGEEKGKTHWLTVKAFRHVASAAMMLSKGQGCHVTGRLAVEEWVGKDGSKKSAVVIVADSIAPWPLKDEKQPQTQLPGAKPEDDDGPF